jgi:hypothetical protein
VDNEKELGDGIQIGDMKFVQRVVGRMRRVNLRGKFNKLNIFISFIHVFICSLWGPVSF